MIQKTVPRRLGCDGGSPVFAGSSTKRCSRAGGACVSDIRTQPCLAGLFVSTYYRSSSARNAASDHERRWKRRWEPSRWAMSDRVPMIVNGRRHCHRHRCDARTRTTGRRGVASLAACTERNSFVKDTKSNASRTSRFGWTETSGVKDEISIRRRHRRLISFDMFVVPLC